MFCTAAVNIRAATIPVSNTNDSGPGSLRAALAGATDGDIIDATGVTGTILLTSGELLVTNGVNIIGPGPTQLTVDGNAVSRVFYIGLLFGFNRTVTISDMTVANGAATGQTFPADSGGGISVNGSTLIVSNCTLDGNTARNQGGGILNQGLTTVITSTFIGNRAKLGGGVFNDRATLNVSNSTFNANTAETGGGICSIGRGCCAATLTVFTSTFSGNSAIGGGGIYNDGVVPIASATLDIGACTFSGNSASRDGGAIYNTGPSGGATFEIGNTILSGGKLGANIFNDAGTVVSVGYNLSSDYGGGYLTSTGDQINTDPMLGPLQDNGGPTFTHALLPCSPAIDQGKNISGSATDQRGVGFSRTFDDPSIANVIDGDGTDIGASEAQTHLVDTTPPTITCPDDITAYATSSMGAIVSFSLPPPANNCLTANVSCSPPSDSTFAIGTTTVTCTATDGSENQANCSFLITVVGPRTLKVSVLNDLQFIRTTVTNKSDGSKLDDALKHLINSLKAINWVDDLHLNRGGAGKSVFNEERRVVNDLQSLIAGNKSGLTAEQLQPLIDDLVLADRLLAEMAINEAIAAQRKPKDISSAQAELAKGDAEANAGHPAKAIDHYKNAWKSVTS